VDGTAATTSPDHRAWVAWTIALLWLAAIALTVVAPTVLSSESAGSYRLLRSLPGIVDVCGTPTLFARSIPPGLALAGVGLTLLVHPLPRTAVALRVGGVLLAAALAFATMQNFVWGQQTCIID
jgi:hypothetical protein